MVSINYTLIAQIVNFIILLWILAKFAYKPLLKTMDDRRTKIVKDMDSAEQSRQQAEQLKETYANQLKEAKQQANAIVAQANTMAQQLHDEALAAAQKEREELLATGRETVELENCSIKTGKKTVVVLSSDKMGEGEEKLGKILIKGFVYALTQLEQLPSAVLFYNSGAFLSCEDSPVLEDLKLLEEEGVEICTCGTCLDFYGLKEKLAVGNVVNMYQIVQTQAQADLILKP